jgi:circadian clock protein KaiC
LVQHKQQLTIIETGISGIDTLLNGGIPVNNQLIIAGGPGSGKTLMMMEILYNSAKKGIPSAFVALEEKSENLVKNFMTTFPGMADVEDLIKKKMLVVDGNDAATKIATNTEAETGYSMGNLMSEIEAIIKSNDAQVVAIDSLSFLKLMLGKTLLFNKSVS